MQIDYNVIFDRNTCRGIRFLNITAASRLSKAYVPLAAVSGINTIEIQRLRGSMQDVRCSNTGKFVRRAELLFAPLLCFTGLAINWLFALTLELIRAITRHLACRKSLGTNSRLSTHPSP